MTKSETLSRDLTALLRARIAILWIVTREEARVETYLAQAARAAKYRAFTWDCAQGLCEDNAPIDATATDLGGVLNAVIDKARQNSEELQQRGERAERIAYILRDAPVWLSTNPLFAGSLRALCNLARLRPTMDPACAQAIIIITPQTEVPAELAGHVTVIDWPSPDKAEIGSILDTIVNDNDLQQAVVNGKREAAIDAALGLLGQEAANCFSKSLVISSTIDPALVSAEKKRIISRERMLEWYDPIPGGLDAVGGLEQLKAWLISRAAAYSPEARAYGLQAPRGALLVGVPGCGKSLIAKAISTAWQCPLLKLDLNALKNALVGKSEENLRRVLKTIEAIGKSVVWIDEIEKALQGATSGSADGGVSTDTLGALLSWMQERQGDAFVIATANDVSALPPELMRKGRFDDVWFVDLPTVNERAAIVQASLVASKRAQHGIDVLTVAQACDQFSGAEISALVPDALFAAFADGKREPETRDLLAAAKTVVPASSTNREALKRLREWAAGRARYASAKTETTAAPVKRTLDI